MAENSQALPDRGEREKPEQLVTDILFGLGDAELLRGDMDGPDVDEARHIVMRELLADERIWEAENDRLRAENETLRAGGKALAAVDSHLLDDLRAEVEELRGTVAHCHDEIDQLATELADERTLTNRLRAENERLREALAQCQNTHDAVVYRWASNALAGRRWNENGETRTAGAIDDSDRPEEGTDGQG
jgi:hypothetical protein